MNILQTTLTSYLFNEIGQVVHAGEYPEQYHSAAIAILEQLSDKCLDECGDGWADLMVNKQSGKFYAVWADSKFNSPVGLLQYIEVDNSDFPFLLENLNK